jgi:GNAT superfamily N-acetyltransferase
VFVATLVTDVELPVGYLVLDRDGAVAHVDQVFVLPEARELGFGDALLAQAVDTARAAGASLIEGHALPGDRDTKNLYERAAITARLITVSKRL